MYRVGHRCHALGWRRLGKCVSYLNRWLFATWVPSSCQIGRGVKLGYWGLGVVIHSRAVIGDNCTIAQNVTIGRKEGSEEVPVIEQGVYIGAGACVLGGVVLGRDSIVGANSVVVTSVLPYSVVAGVPSRVLRTRSEQEVLASLERRKSGVAVGG
jgi:serine O-acetyltransferase